MPDKQTLAGAGGNPEVRHLKVSEDFAGQRLDNFLSRELKGVPRGHIYRLLRTGQVRVNGGRRKPDYRLEAGDEVRIPPVRVPERTETVGPLRRGGAVLESGILHEDDSLLIVNKPSGLPVHGGSGLDGGLIEALRRLRGEPGLELAHRLDRDTSGCLVIARKRSALRALHAAFREGRVDKRYLALVAGRVPKPFTSEAPLERFVKQGGERHVAVTRAGRAARTRFRPLARGDEFTLVEALPDTGRTHQIRVHATHSGHPIAGDPRYGDKSLNRKLRQLGLRRLALHAAGLSFEHPGTGERMNFTAPVPDDLLPVVTRLTGYQPKN
ncbi:MAG TPA: RluA family pseudouridine synthase [Gammaproteobacteria bacterium]|nr:RluA family pseudouridine synthase [Gammaproteobacteria bacterium]